MKGFGNLVKEAQKLQAQLEALKEEVGKKKVEASAGGGMVVVEANGNQELVSIKIDREVVSPDDPQMLEDLVLAAANEALRKARELVASEMARVTGGLGGAIAEWCLENGVLPRRFRRIGLRDEFATVVGSQDYLRERYAMGADAIAKTGRAMLGAER